MIPQPELDAIFPVEWNALKISSCALVDSTAHSLRSRSISKDVGSFAREAQASYLLIQVQEALSAPRDDPKGAAELADLDTTLQKFLGVCMEQAAGTFSAYCGSINMSIA